MFSEVYVLKLLDIINRRIGATHPNLDNITSNEIESVLRFIYPSPQDEPFIRYVISFVKMHGIGK
jgi:hypothetical protein